MIRSRHRVRTPAERALDQAVWAQYAASVRPLPGRDVPSIPPAPVPSVVKLAAPAVDVTAPVAVRARKAALARIEVGAVPSGLDKGSSQRFRAGRIMPTRRLDLHGMTVARAHPAVIALIEQAAACGERCVEIVTGSGPRGAEGFLGVLQREVPFWLNEPGLRAQILALSHPHPNNPGAIRVLIRRKRGD